MSAQPRLFLLSIATQHAPDGDIIGYALQSENDGVRNEVVFTLMRNWLRMEEDKFHTNFIGKH